MLSLTYQSKKTQFASLSDGLQQDTPITLSFSIIIPTRNESKDIRRTLENCLSIDYEQKEILVVDDSTDDTPDIVNEYSARGVKLIRRKKNSNGCCGARNLGMREASGDIIVICNADVLLPPDFLCRLKEHYAQGADWVVAWSEVLNTETLWGKYVKASELGYWEQRTYEPRWTEGFSCRRAAAEAVGYIPGDFPVNFCRDHLLGKQLLDAGYIRHIDRSLAVPHIVPDNFREFWNNRVWRGTFSAPMYFYQEKHSIIRTGLRESARVIKQILNMASVIPILIRAYRFAKHIGGAKRIPKLMWVIYVNCAAQIIGSIKGLKTVIHVETK